MNAAAIKPIVDWDVIVAGAGHAGCEAALATARMGFRVALLTLNLDYTAQMSCNPAIGGLGKGQLVREIDALGGEMANATDRAGIQFRLLNTSKGPAVRAPRAQADRKLYRDTMRRTLLAQPGLSLIQERVESLIVINGHVAGVRGRSGAEYHARAVILTAGTFLRGRLHLGDAHFPGGRMGEPAADMLTENLIEIGFQPQRLKTCTPPRIDGRTIDFDKLQRQDGDDVPVPFSFSTSSIDIEQKPCYLGRTNRHTHKIISDALDLSPMLDERMRGAGPRYCPSVEDKIDAFPDRESHHLFLEPEGLETPEFYVNGLFTGLPANVQIDMIRSVEGMENALITQYGYAVEYDFFQPTGLRPTLESKNLEGLYFAGQVNGTSGYEEAAAQGLMAGINVALKLKGEYPLILRRDEAYIGVLIDDLVTKGTEEPYRMFSSRAEYRLLLRHSNADRRLMGYGHRAGLISEVQYERMLKKEKAICELVEWMRNERIGGRRPIEMLQKGEGGLRDFVASSDAPPPFGLDSLSDEAVEEAETEVKYEGYIQRQTRQVERFRGMEQVKLPDRLDYSRITGLSAEGRDKLARLRPVSLGQASRISGVSPADISVLMVYLRAGAK